MILSVQYDAIIVLTLLRLLTSMAKNGTLADVRLHVPHLSPTDPDSTLSTSTRTTGCPFKLKGEAFWGFRDKKKKCAYSAKCAISRKELEKKVRTGETVNVEELAAKHGVDKIGRASCRERV